MKNLILLRGCPSVGKSTWIEKNGLKDYTLSADDIRLLYRSTVIDCNGKENIDQSINKQAWKTLFEILEKRMELGEFTVIDACNSKSSELNAYKSLAEKYRYRIYCIDFTDIPIEQAKEWNKKRPEYKRVPEKAIDLYYSRFQTQKIPSGIQVLKRDEVFDNILFRDVDLSNYENVYVIGDIHGCFTALKDLLVNGIEENNYYIFLGDYIDRGIENKEVLEYLMSIKDKSNVCLLEGNHGKWIWRYANDEPICSKEFIQNTIPQIKDLDKKDLRQLYRKFRQCIAFIYGGQKYICTHGGLSGLKNNNLLFTATNEIINGVGNYNDIYACHDSFAKMCPNIIQIHGHRNPNNVGELKQGDNSYNLESRVEFGGFLSAVKISNNGIEEIKIKNNVFREIEEEPADVIEEKKDEIVDVANLVTALRKNKNIIEKKFDNISSFNFSKNVFYDKAWDNMTTKARGLFIDTENNEVCSRAYPKFFNINEVKETEMSTLSTKLKFPVDCYVKYNGFLGILGYDKKNDKLLFCSKSNVGGEFSQYFENIFMGKYGDKYNDIKEFIKTTNTSMVFEIIDKDNDPHIIEYSENKIVLLDIIKREIEYHKFNYTDLCNIANKFNMQVKEKAYTLTSWAEFLVWFTDVCDEEYKYKGEYIEGFVIEDANGFMTKIKGAYYKFWKFMRKIKDEVFRLCKDGSYKGYIDKTSCLTTSEMNLFYGFLRKLAEENYNGKLDIVSLRNLYYKK